MDAARAAGRTVQPDSDALVIRGPRTAGPLAQALLARKACVLAALAVEQDEFADLRARLACGCLNGYGTLVLADGTTIYDVIGHARRRLADLDDPWVSDEATRRLRALVAELARLDALEMY